MAKDKNHLLCDSFDISSIVTSMKVTRKNRDEYDHNVLECMIRICHKSLVDATDSGGVHCWGNIKLTRAAVLGEREQTLPRHRAGRLPRHLQQPLTQVACR